MKIKVKVKSATDNNAARSLRAENLRNQAAPNNTIAARSLRAENLREKGLKIEARGLRAENLRKDKETMDKISKTILK